MPLEAVEARRLYRQVADQLRALIDSGESHRGRHGRDRRTTSRQSQKGSRVSLSIQRESKSIDFPLGSNDIRRVAGEATAGEIAPAF